MTAADIFTARRDARTLPAPRWPRETATSSRLTPLQRIQNVQHMARISLEDVIIRLEQDFTFMHLPPLSSISNPSRAPRCRDWVIEQIWNWSPTCDTIASAWLILNPASDREGLYSLTLRSLAIHWVHHVMPR